MEKFTDFQKRRIKHLKVKCKTLAAEAKIIKLEASKARKPVDKVLLTEHRKNVVRVAARHNLLAYALCRGIDYHVIEQKVVKAGPPNWPEVKRLACRFGADREYADQWIEDARKPYQTVQGIVKDVDTSQFKEGEKIYTSHANRIVFA